jgi:hypothetical protein
MFTNVTNAIQSSHNNHNSNMWSQYLQQTATAFHFLYVAPSIYFFIFYLGVLCLELSIGRLTAVSAWILLLLQHLHHQPSQRPPRGCP